MVHGVHPTVMPVHGDARGVSGSGGSGNTRCVISWIWRAVLIICTGIRSGMGMSGPWLIGLIRVFTVMCGRGITRQGGAGRVVMIVMGEFSGSRARITARCCAGCGVSGCVGCTLCTIYRPGMDGAHGAPYGSVVWGVFRAPFTRLHDLVRMAHPTVRCVRLRRVHSVHHLRVCMIWCTECTLR